MAFKTQFGDVAKDQRTSYPGELVKELTDAFEFFDLNGDGKLSVQEMATVVRSLSAETVAEDDLAKLISGVDVDGDGCLDLHEFIDLNTQAINNFAGVDAESSEIDVGLVAAFNKFDADGDGFISAQELHKVLVGFGDKTYSLEECRGMISGADENGDQVISLQEFQALMNRQL